MDLKRLEQLRRLHQSGALSDEEFETEKAKLFAARSPAVKVFLIGLALAFAIVIGIAMFSVMRPSLPENNFSAANSTASNEETVVEERADVPTSDTDQPAVLDENSDVETRSTVESEDVWDQRAHREAEALKKVSPEIRQAVQEYQEIDADCRGGSGNSEIVCDDRDQKFMLLYKSGMCFGHPSDRSAIESYWHKCDPGDPH